MSARVPPSLLSPQNCPGAGAASSNACLAPFNFVQACFPQAFLDCVFLKPLCDVAPGRFDLADRDQDRRRNDGLGPFLLRRLSSIRQPSEAVRINDPHHDVPNAFGLVPTPAQRSRSEVRLREDLEVIFGHGWCGQVAECSAHVVVAHQVGQQVRIEWIAGQRRQLVDQPIEYRCECLYISRIDAERFSQPPLAKRLAGVGGISYQFV